MTVIFDYDNEVNDITVDEEDKQDVRLIFQNAGLILGGMLYESGFELDKLDSINLIGELLDTAQFDYNWRYNKKQKNGGHNERPKI